MDKKREKKSTNAIKKKLTEFKSYLKIRHINKKKKKQEMKDSKKEYLQTKPLPIRIIYQIWKVFSKTFISIFGIIFILGIIALSISYPYIKEARTTAYNKLKHIDANSFQHYANTVIYDKDENIIGEINNSSFSYVELKNASDYITEGYIAVEDKNFKSHIGIDPQAILRAGLSYIKNKGHISQGGSTITQQLVKNNILSSEQTFQRKLAEIFIAIDLEARPDITKENIMEWYINSNFYGNNNYGIGAACSYYFKKSAKDVTPAEAAIIITLSNAPSRYDPIQHYDDCIEHARIVLNTMYNENVITDEEYNKAKSDFDIGIQIYQYREDTKNSTNYMATYAIHSTTEILMQQNGFEFKYIFDSPEEEQEYNQKYQEAYEEYQAKIRNGGYEIYTSFDQNIQNILQETIDTNLAKDTSLQNNGIYALQGAATVIDNSTNYIVAIVGGRSGSGEYNRGYQGVRQPGSSIKPILDYAPAFDTGRYNPGTIVSDTVIENGPKNWYKGNKGNVTVRYALEQSINTTAYKTLDDIGVKNGLNYLAKMKFSHLDFTDTQSPIVSIGGFTKGVTTDEMAKAYNALENQGNFSNRTCIKAIKEKNEQIYTSSAEELTQIYSKDTAYMITDCLKSVVEKGIANKAKVDGQIVVGKTGTTNDNKDSWFCGYSKYYTCAFWTGFDTPKTITIDSNVTTIMFHDFMSKISNNLQKADFVKPETVIEKSGDLVSTTNNSQMTKKSTDIEYDTAITALSTFENFDIKSETDAEKYIELCIETENKLNQITDTYQYAELNSRYQTKKASLDKQYNVYKESIENKKLLDKDILDLKNQQSEEAAEKATAEKKRNDAINAVKTYIEMINNSTDYGVTEIEIEKKANNILENDLLNTSDYSELKDKLNSAIINLKNKNEEIKPTEEQQTDKNTSETLSPST